MTQKIILFVGLSIFAFSALAEPPRPQPNDPSKHADLVPNVPGRPAASLVNPCCWCRKEYYSWEPNPWASTSAPMTFTDLFGIDRFRMKKNGMSSNGLVRVPMDRGCGSLVGNKVEFTDYTGKEIFSVKYVLSQCTEVRPVGGACRFSEEGSADKASFKAIKDGQIIEILDPRFDAQSPPLKEKDGSPIEKSHLDPILNTIPGQRGKITSKQLYSPRPRQNNWEQR
jgi:hypothetical protein